MSLLFRAIWRDDRTAVCKAAADQFSEWVSEKGIGLDVPADGSVDDSLGNEISSRQAEANGVQAAQFELVEDRRADDEIWTTRLIAIDDGDQERWLWVDLERVTGDPMRRRPIAAPRLVGRLIQTGDDPRVDQVRLTATPNRINATGLIGLIRNQERSLPIVVITEDATGGPELSARRAEKSAGMLAGAAQVMVLPGAEQDEFNSRVGEGLGIWGGAARIYMPNRGPAGLRPALHRYVTPSQMGRDAWRCAEILSALISPTATARRPPEVFERVRRELRRGHLQSDSELLRKAELDVERLGRERLELLDRIEAVENDRFDTQADYEDAVRDSTRLGQRVQQLTMELAGRNGDPSAFDGVELFVSPQNASEALGFARSILSGLVIPQGVERDLPDLDCHMNCVSWGQTLWKGLLALHIYATSGWDGNFKNWCSDSGHDLAWSSSDKKLALRESETVESSSRYREQRRFPVAETVDPTGKVLMWAHLKIAEGGGPLAPRVYFHDDTRGESGKVHIGYVGPHRYVENTRTN